MSAPHHHINTRINKGEDHRGNLEADLICAAAGKQVRSVVSVLWLGQVVWQRCAQVPMIVQRSSQSSSAGQDAQLESNF